MTWYSEAGVRMRLHARVRPSLAVRRATYGIERMKREKAEFDAGMVTTGPITPKSGILRRLKSWVRSGLR